jgi:ATP-dependent protease Clp ATPase subunit
LFLLSQDRDAVGKLISGPSDYPRALICDECVAVCHMILRDDEGDLDTEAAALDANGNLYLRHPCASELIAAMSTWVAREAEGLDASKELAEVRRLATLIFGQEPGSA